MSSVVAFVRSIAFLLAVFFVVSAPLGWLASADLLDASLAGLLRTVWFIVAVGLAASLSWRGTFAPKS